MSWTASIPIIGKLFSDAGDIIKETVVDKDAQNRILEKLEMAKLTIEKDLHAKELEIKTVPWVDALHKMGRQIINLITIGVTAALLLMEIDISPSEVMLLGGGNVAYQIIKGKGK